MSLAASLTVKLDSSALRADLTGSLGTAGGDLGGIGVAVSVDEVTAAAASAQGLDFGDIAAAVSQSAAGLGNVAATIPGADTLIGPISAGIAALETALAGDLESGLRASIDRLTADLADLEAGSGLDALRRVLSEASGEGGLKPLFDLLQALMGLGGGGALPGTGALDLASGALTLLEATGGLMALESALADSARMGRIAAGHLPAGKAEALIAAWEAELAAVEAALAGLDPTDDAAVAVMLDRLGGLRTRADTLVEGVRAGMAMGEATLTLTGLPQTVARMDAILERLRGAALAPVREAIATLSGHLRPLLQWDLSELAQDSIDGLFAKLETRAGEVAGEIAALDTAIISDPIATTLGTVTSAATAVREGIEAALGTLLDALETVRRAVAALPLQAVSDALQAAVGAVAAILDRFGTLLNGVQAAIGTGAAAAQAALDAAETAVTRFRDAMDALFGEARAFIDGLNLDAVIGQTADAIQSVADAIGKADMAPYFRTAQDVIGTTADVVDKLPFDLLPDSMEQDLVDAIRPIKTADTAGFADEIKSVLQIGPDGKFTLRPDLEAAVAGVQAKLAELVAALADLDPRLLAAEIDAALADFAAEVAKIEPAVALTPVTEALDEAKAAVAGLDPDALLQPLRDGFATVLAAIDEVMPSKLLAPVQSKVDELRGKVLDLSHLTEWRAEIDRMETQLLDMAALADPVALEAPLTEAVSQARTELAENGLPDPLQPFGALIDGLLAGGPETPGAGAMAEVARWLRGGGGAARLEGLATGLAASVTATRAAVAAAAPPALATRLGAGRTRLDAAVARLAAGTGRDRLATAVALGDLSVDLAALGPAHGRYLAFLDAQAGALNGLVAKGFGEADSIAEALRAAFAPLAAILDGPRELLQKLGFTRLPEGVFALIDELFSVITPGRIVGLVLPIFAALHGRLAALLGAVLAPIRNLIDDLIGIVNAFDLAPIAASLDAVVTPVRDAIAALSPDAVLGAGLTAFRNAQTAVANFDPLGPVLAVIETLQDTIARVLALLDGEALLAVPITVYDEIVGLLSGLDLNGLLTPLYDRLDALSAQVGTGLDGTVTAFRKLQDALPDRVGSTSVMVTVSVEAG